MAQEITMEDKIMNKPELANFQLNEGLVKEIEDYNEKQKVGYQKRETKKGVIVVILIFGFCVFLFWNFKGYAFLIIFILGWVWVLLDSFIYNFKKTGTKKHAYSFHPLSGNLENYKKAKELYERYQSNFWFSLSGHKFEKEVANILRNLGYKVILTKGSGDQGVDIFVDDIDGKKIVIQCKAHKNPVGPNIIRELQGVVIHFKADKGVLINLGGFTKGVRNFVENKNLYLVDVKDIINLQNGLHSGKWEFAGVNRKL